MRRTMRVRRLLAAFVVGLFWASAGMAGSCGYDYCWGAVAVGPDGIVARSSGRRTAPEAAERADTACGGKCPVIEVFSNGCAAIVQDSDEKLSAGFAGTRADAIAEAKGACNWDGRNFCRVRVWACTY